MRKLLILFFTLTTFCLPVAAQAGEAASNRGASWFWLMLLGLLAAPVLGQVTSSYSSLRPPIKTIADDEYEITRSDCGKVLRFTSDNAITLTVPAGLGSKFNCAVIQRGDGQITFTEDGTTLANPASHTKTIKNGVTTIFADTADNLIFQGATE